MANFGGWSMPIEYVSVIAEHQSVRERVGLFDVSHLGKVLVRGPGAVEFLNSTLSNDLTRIGPGNAQYTLCCNESGGVVDDLLVYLRTPEDLLLVPNAANTADVVQLLAQSAPTGVQVISAHSDLGVLALQGPFADQILTALGIAVDLAYLGFTDLRWRNGPLMVARTGYTGEFGYELIVPWAATGALWDALAAAVTQVGGQLVGLGARDTLRTEMGYPLHGQDLAADISPVQAQLSWAVGWKKAQFWGRAALLAQREAATGQQLWGLLPSGRGVPRAKCEVRAANGQALGQTTSGTFSPTLRQGIALALLDRSVQPGAAVIVEVRGRELPCQVVTPPFVDARPRRKPLGTG